MLFVIITKHKSDNVIVTNDLFISFTDFGRDNFSKKLIKITNKEIRI